MGREELTITGLSVLNIKAIRETWPDETMGTIPGDDIMVTTTPSTATFKRTHGGPIASGNLLAVLRRGQDRYPKRVYPEQPLDEVVRKVCAVFLAEDIEEEA